MTDSTERRKGRGKGKPFEPGKAPNPVGRPKLSPELKLIQALTGESVKRLISLLAGQQIEDIKALAAAPDTPALEGILARIMVTAYEEADHYKLSFLLDRCIGKVKDVVDVNDERQKAIDDKISKISKDKIVELLRNAKEDTAA